VIRNQHAFKFGTNLRFQKHVDDRSSVAGVLTRARIFLGTAQNPVPPNFGTGTSNTLVPGINAADRSRLDSWVNDILGRVGTINQAAHASTTKLIIPSMISSARTRGRLLVI
jgi:hypothetical protein